MVDWSQLPNDLLVLIAKRLKTGSDVSRFQSVCTSWRSLVLPHKPRRLKIPTYDPHVADHFYLLERTIYLVGKPETFSQRVPPQLWFVKVEEDEHGIMHLLHPLTSFKIKTSAFQNVLDSSKFRVYEWSKEHVLQYNPKDHAACELLEYDYERKLAFKKVAFKSLSPDCEDFELLLEPALGRLVLFKSTDMQWTTRNVPIYRDYYVIPFRGRFLTVTASSDMVNISYPCKIFLIDLKDGGLVRVEIYYSSSVGQFDCLKPDGELVSFQIYMMNDDQQNWTIVGSLGDVVLFLGTNCTFPCTASYLPPNCKGNCIVFCEPRWESTYVRGHDIYVADLQTRQIHPLKNSPGYSNLFRPPHDPLTWTRYQSWKKELSFALRRFLASELLL